MPAEPRPGLAYVATTRLWWRGCVDSGPDSWLRIASYSKPVVPESTSMKGPVSAETRSLTDLVLEHLALAATTAVFMFVAVRVLVVVRMNIDTALAVVSTAGAVEVALAIIISSYWAVILTLYLIADAWRRRSHRAGRSIKSPLNLQLFVGLMAIVFVPWTVVALFGVLSVAYGYMDAWLEKVRGIEPEPWTSSGLLAGLLVFVAFFVASNVWLPPEVIATDDLQDPFVGYVLATDDGWTSVLEDEERTIVRIKSSLVTSRVVCTMSGEGGRGSLIEVFLEPANVVSCEEAIRDASRVGNP